MYSIQGLKTVSNSLPKGLKKIFKKGGHNYNSIIENWSNLVGKKISDVCYPKSIKTNRELKDGLLILNVFHGDQLFVEYNKNEIIDKINVFFGYQFIKDIKLLLIKEKIDKINKLHRELEINLHKYLNIFRKVFIKPYINLSLIHI